MIVTITLFLLLSLLFLWAYKVYYYLNISPLKDIPGPLLLLLFPQLDDVLTLDFKAYQRYDKYHKKYGPIVRVGWTKVIISTEEGVEKIYLDPNCIKGSFYKKVQKLLKNLFSMTDKQEHKKRKKILMPSFSLTFIKTVEYKVIDGGINPLIKTIHEKLETDSTIDLLGLFKLTTLDIIGVVSFGKSFNALKTGKAEIQDWLNKGFIYFFIAEAILFLKLFPNIYYRKVMTFALNCVKEAKEIKKEDTVLNSLIEAINSETNEKLSDYELASEALSQIVAGSDSTANALTWFFYLLLKNPAKLEVLSNEINQKVNEEKDISKINRSEMKYLKACIKESMRLISGVPDVLWRLIPKNGKVIEGYYLPEGTEVGSNAHTLHTSESLWGQDANEFKPERWIKHNQLIANNSKFIPFSVGNRACIGRNLAQTMMELIIIHLLTNFELELLSKDYTLTPQTLSFTAPKEGCFNVKFKVKVV
ncbi:cytochrome P450 [Neoconidiobolus thromboides FSU 785]|nr:cytochrome P450 [Neoconidiobolus thromboides FSU 785]